MWAAFAGSGHFASFDRRKCKVLNGPTATGNHCPEGWTVHWKPGPKMKGVADNVDTDWYYLNWVDQFNTLGLGENVPLAPGTNSDSVIAFLPDKNEFVTLRVPYPMGFYSRGMDGRIDDPNAGWKGRALWTTYASISPWNVEGGKGTFPKVVKRVQTVPTLSQSDRRQLIREPSAIERWAPASDVPILRACPAASAPASGTASSSRSSSAHFFD